MLHRYDLNYKRTASISGFKVRGMFKVVNPHAATVTLDRVTFSISRPTGAPLTGEADCSGTVQDGYPAASETPGSDAGALSKALNAVTTAQPRKKAMKVMLAAARPHKRRGIGAVVPAQYEEDQEVGTESDEGEYEDGGTGPLFCSFEADLPDDYPAVITLSAVTDQDATGSITLDAIDWTKATMSRGDK